MLLRKGMSSPDVLNLELVLQGLGFGGFEADGIFDDKTENLIRYIQRAHGLTVDGIVGEKTFTKLEALFEPDKENFPHLKPKEFEVISTTSDSKRLENVHPILASRVHRIIGMAAKEGYRLRVSQGLRTFAEQDALFAQGRTKTKDSKGNKLYKVTNARGGQSYHNYGLAADLVFIGKDRNGKEIALWEEKLYKNLGRWASQVGLTWGGHWKFVDNPHVQLTSLPSVAALLSVYNANGKGDKGVQAVWKRFIG